MQASDQSSSLAHIISGQIEHILHEPERYPATLGSMCS